jgi:hypothetical protein
MMRHKDDLQPPSPRGRDHLAQVIEQLHFLSDRFYARPEFAALAEEVVVGVDQEDRSGRGIVARRGLPPLGLKALMQKFACARVGKRRRCGVVVRAIVPGECVTLTRIAVDGRVGFAG